MSKQQLEKQNLKSLIKVLFFDYKIQQKEIAKALWIHRNTVWKYLKKDLT